MLTPGVRFGPYEIGVPVGSGGMGGSIAPKMHDLTGPSP